MASLYIIDLDKNDELESVVEKCNQNFRLIVSQMTKQAKVNQRSNNEQIAIDVTELVSNAVGDEAGYRIAADADLQDQIDHIDPSAAVLAAYPVGSLYLSEESAQNDPSTFIGGTWDFVDQYAIAGLVADVWIRIA